MLRKCILLWSWWWFSATARLCGLQFVCHEGLLDYNYLPSKFMIWSCVDKCFIWVPGICVHDNVWKHSNHDLFQLNSMPVVYQHLPSEPYHLHLKKFFTFLIIFKVIKVIPRDENFTCFAQFCLFVLVLMFAPKYAQLGDLVSDGVVLMLYWAFGLFFNALQAVFEFACPFTSPALYSCVSFLSVEVLKINK